jgi:hypothetical protein
VVRGPQQQDAGCQRAVWRRVPKRCCLLWQVYADAGCSWLGEELQDLAVARLGNTYSATDGAGPCCCCCCCWWWWWWWPCA